VNYVEITKEFMHLLKKEVPLCWDEAAQCSFEALKCTLMSAPLLWPPDYNRYLLLYFTTTTSTIGMVLVQEDDMLEENTHDVFWIQEHKGGDHGGDERGGYQGGPRGGYE